MSGGFTQVLLHFLIEFIFCLTPVLMPFLSNAVFALKNMVVLFGMNPVIWLRNQMKEVIQIRKEMGVSVLKCIILVIDRDKQDHILLMCFDIMCSM